MLEIGMPHGRKHVWMLIVCLYIVKKDVFFVILKENIMGIIFFPIFIVQKIESENRLNK